MAERAPVGFFGKIPQRGDFVGAGLGRDFLDVWDPWLQDAIACSRDQLGEGWLEVYLTAPIWRFALCGGICGDAAWAGVLLPGVDRVGRYFPLTIAAPLPADGNPLQYALLADDWFQRAEEVALAPLADDAPDLTEFAERVRALGAPDCGDDEATRQVPMIADPALRVEAASESQSLASRQGALAGGLLSGLLLRYAVWWSEGSERVAPNLLVTKHLPAVEKFAAMLDGDWQGRGWSGGRQAPLAVMEEA